MFAQFKMLAAASVTFAGAAGLAYAQDGPGYAQCIEGCPTYCSQNEGQMFGSPGYRNCIATCNAYVAQYCDGAMGREHKSPASMTVYERAQMLVRKAEPVRQSFAPVTADK